MQHPDIPANLFGYTVRNPDGSLVGFLGEGGFGRTFQGFAGTQEVAIKVARDLKPETLKRVSGELSALIAVAHGNLVRGLGFKLEESGICIAMELCKGGNLRNLVKIRGGLPEDVALLIVQQAAEGLHAAHEAGLVHRDIKPENFLVAEDISGLSDADLFAKIRGGALTVQVADLGLAIRPDDLLAGQRRGSGTPRYSSPEQIRKSGQIDRRSDLYSLGLTLWELLRGTHPFGGELPKEIHRRHLSASPHAIPEDLPVSAETRRLLERLLEKDPDRRVGTAAEVAASIRSILGQEAAATDRSVPGLGDAAFGQGDDADFYEEIGGAPLRVRPLGEAVAAKMRGDGRIVALTRWSLSFDGIGSELEPNLRSYLGRLYQAVREDPSRSLTPIIEVRRTHQGWRVAEEWEERPSLAQYLASWKRPLTVEAAALLLQPLSIACDHLYGSGIEMLPLDVAELELDIGPGQDFSELVRLPLTEWTDWRVRCSALALPGEFLKRIDREQAELSRLNTLSSSSSGVDGGSYDLKRSYCRLLYRLVEGAEVPVEAEWDPGAYVEAGNLSAPSNLLLKDWISEESSPPSAAVMLQRICENEGVYRHSQSVGSVPARTSIRTATRTTIVPGGAAALPPAPQSPGPGSPISVAGRSHSGEASRSTGTSFSVGGSLPEPRLTAAVVGPGRVRSPYGSRSEQDVPGHLWRPRARLACRETGRGFVLPDQLVHLLEARPLPGRFDAVLTPYVEGGAPVPVPPERWLPGEEVVCPATGLEMRLPDDLPFPEAVPVPGKPGWVLLPGLVAGEIPVSASEWVEGGFAHSPRFALPFRLPAARPPLQAEPAAERPGLLRSPHAPEAAPFAISTSDLAAGSFLCPHTGHPLAIPPPESGWAFPGEVLASPFASVRSPYDGSVHALSLEEWRPGGTVVRGGRRILLPGELPIIPLAPEALAAPCRVRLPFDPAVAGKALGRAYPISADSWEPGAAIEISVELEGAAPVPVAVCLPDDLLDLLPLAEYDDIDAAARTVKGPFGGCRSISLDPVRWKAGEPLDCPSTKRRFRLPDPMPLLVGEVLEGRPGRVRSPYHPDRVVEIGLECWIPGAEVEDPGAPDGHGRLFRLPADLPDWLEDASPVPLRPGWVLSPYGSRGEVKVTPADWRPGARVPCPETGRMFRVGLAEDAPPLDLEQAVVDHALGNPSGNDRRIVEALSGRFAGLSRGTVRALLSRHGLGTEEARRAALPVAEVLRERCGRIGMVRPFSGAEPLEVPAVEWRPGARREDPSGKPYRLPDRLEPLVGATPAPGMCASPYVDGAGPQPVSPAKLWWEEEALVRCSETGLDYRLPPLAERPPWNPAGEAPAASSLRPGKRPEIRSPHGAKAWQKVDPADWEAGRQLRCEESGAPFVLPDPLPPLPADPATVAGDTIRSPYAPGAAPVRVPAAQWRSGGTVECPATRRSILLPEGLPEHLFDGLSPVAAGSSGCITSPYRPEAPSIEVEGPRWNDGERIACPASGRAFRLPAGLPPLEAEPVEGRPGWVRSPYGDRTVFEVLPKVHWKAGEALICPATQRRLFLPGSLPPLPAVPVAGRPGFVLSPYTDPPREVRIPRRQWRPGGTAVCPATGRSLLLPGELPPLAGRPAAALLASSVAALLVLAAGLWWWTRETESVPRGGASSPVSDNGQSGKGGGEGDGPSASPTPWPAKVSLLNGVSPSYARIEAVLDGKTRRELEPGKDGLVWDIDLAGILLRKAEAAPESIALVFSAEGFRSQELAVDRRDGGWPGGAMPFSERIALERIKAKVDLSGDLGHPCYGKVRFAMVKAPSGAVPADPVEHPLDPGPILLPTGVYRVSLVGREGLRNSKGPIRVEERVLHEGLELGEGSDGATVAIPAWPLPRAAAGVERTTLLSSSYAFFGRPMDRDIGYISRDSTVPVERAFVLELGTGRLEGKLYGEASVLFDPNAFDTLAVNFANNLVERSDNEHGKGRKKDGGIDFARILPYLERFAAAVDSDASAPLASPPKAWERRWKRIDALAGLARRFEAYYIESGQGIITAESLVTPEYERKLEQAKQESYFIPLCQANWLASLHPQEGTPTEFSNTAIEYVRELERYRAEDRRAIGLPGQEAQQRRLAAWRRFVEAVFGEAPPRRSDLELLAAPFRAGEYQGALLAISALSVSRVGSDGSLGLDIDLVDDGGRASAAKTNLRMEVLEGGVLRLDLGRTSPSELLLRPTTLAD